MKNLSLLVLRLAVCLIACGAASSSAFDTIVLKSPDEQPGAGFGGSVSPVGDFDGDGLDDFIVSQYVYSGRDISVITVIPAGGTGAGDANGDGLADVIAGDMCGGQECEGRAYVFGGPDGSLMLELVSPNPWYLGLFGSSVGGAGDVDQDGHGDVLVGASAEWVRAYWCAGRAYVFSGHDGRPIHQLVSPRPKVNGEFGKSIASIGDVDRDGIPDFVVGAPREIPPGTVRDVGRAWVFSGSTGSLLFAVDSPNTPAEWGGEFGWSVASGGDLNRDGYPDLLVGAPGEDDEHGAAYAFSGRDGSLLFQLVPPPGVWARFGHSVAGGADLNRDGWNDIAVITRYEEPGRVYVYDGRAGEFLYGLAAPQVSTGIYAAFLSVAILGEVSQDGFAGLLVGAPADGFPPYRPTPFPPRRVAPGRAYLFVPSDGDQ
jgi:hypothetical protein